MSTTITAAEINPGDVLIRGIQRFQVTDVRRFLNPFKIKVRALREDLEWVEPNIKTFGLFDPTDTVERAD
jgi:hypothetical protein